MFAYTNLKRHAGTERSKGGDEKKIGEVTAREMAVTGIDWDFSPTLAVVRDDRWGRTYEGFSEDPEIVRAYAGMMVEGLQGVPGSPDFLGASHVIATAKHFVGDGGTDLTIREDSPRALRRQGASPTLPGRRFSTPAGPGSRGDPAWA